MGISKGRQKPIVARMAGFLLLGMSLLLVVAQSARAGISKNTNGGSSWAATNIGFAPSPTFAYLVPNKLSLETVENEFYKIIKQSGAAVTLVDANDVKTGAVNLSLYRSIGCFTYGDSASVAAIDNVVVNALMNAVNAGTTFMSNQHACGARVMSLSGYASTTNGTNWYPVLRDSVHLTATANDPLFNGVVPYAGVPGSQTVSYWDSGDQSSLLSRLESNRTQNALYSISGPFLIAPNRYLASGFLTSFTVGAVNNQWFPEWQWGKGRIVLASGLDWTFNQVTQSGGYIGIAGRQILQNLAMQSKKAKNDFNGDAKSDILWRHSSGATVLWLMNGSTLSIGKSLGIVPPDWSIAGMSDFNGDGKEDILWHHSSGITILWLMNGSTLLSATSLGVVPTSWSIIGTADFNGDGKGDILWRHSSGVTSMWLMNGATVQSSGSLGTVPTSWAVADTADFNGDGKSDILWRHSSGITVMWLLNGSSILSGGFLGTIPTSWSIAGTADFDGDGKSDILWHHSSGITALWLMNGTTLLSGNGLGVVPPSWSIIDTADFNGDGKGDILWRHSSGVMVMWLMNGATIQSSGSPGSVPTPWSVQK